MGVRFFGVFFFLLFEDEHRQNVPSGRRGEEKWLYSHGKTLVKFSQIHWQLEILHISCRLEVSPSDFDNILRLLLSVGFCRKSESLVKFIDQYHDLSFSCTSQAQVEIAISRCFQDRILRRVTRTSGPCCRLPPNPYFFWLRHLKLYYHANQIWHVCNNLLDAMVQVPYGNCFWWLKNNSQTLREERTLQQPVVKTETIMLSERATLLRDICSGIWFLAKNVVSFSFTLDWFLFLHFLSSTGKKKS